YTLFFIGGILIYPPFKIFGLEWMVYITAGLFLFYLVTVLVNLFQPHYQYKLIFPISAYLLLISMGLLFTYLKDAKNDTSHLMYMGQVEGYLGVVEDLDQKKPNTFANRLQRSEEHTSELQSRENLVCRLLLEKKKIYSIGS